MEGCWLGDKLTDGLKEGDVFRLGADDTLLEGCWLGDELTGGDGLKECDVFRLDAEDMLLEGCWLGVTDGDGLKEGEVFRLDAKLMGGALEGADEGCALGATPKPSREDFSFSVFDDGRFVRVVATIMAAMTADKITVVEIDTSHHLVFILAR